MQIFDRTVKLKRFQPLDRAAIALMVVLSALIGLLLLSGDRSAPRVRNFSWQDRQVGAEDTAFILTFSRPMDHASVESNLQLKPPLPGKISWAGRRMAYTLESPAPYGTAFAVQLQDAQDYFSQAGEEGTPLQPFVGHFSARDRAFVFLGVEGEEAGRLILYNLTQQQQKILTPPDLVVMDFKPYTTGDRILFSAIASTEGEPDLLSQQLYTVTTGIQPQSPVPPSQAAERIFDFSALFKSKAPPPEPAGNIQLVLDNKDYQNLKFDLSPDGKTIVVQRVNQRNPADFGLWMLQSDATPQPIKTEPGGDFLIAPDSSSLAVAQGQGLAILPLASEAELLDFLPKFGMVLSFARDGSAAAMVKFNSDYTRSLFFVSDQGEKELLRTVGSILSAQFDPTQQVLYCLRTELLPGDEYLEQPYLSVINIKTAELTDLLKLPMQRDIQTSLAPDGLALLFDQVVPVPAQLENESSARGLQTDEGKAIATSRLWLLPLAAPTNSSTLFQPEPLPFTGLRPRWLP